MAQREVEKWITVSGQHIPIFKGEDVRKKFNNFYKQKKVKYAFRNFQNKYKDYVDEYNDGIIRFPTDKKPDEIEDMWKGNVYGKYEVTSDDLEKGPVHFVVYGRHGTYYYIYKNQKEMMKDWTTYGGLTGIVGTGREKVRYGIYSAAGVGEYFLERDNHYKNGWKWTDANGYAVDGAKRKSWLMDTNNDAWKKRLNTKFLKKQGLKVKAQMKKVYKDGMGQYTLDLPIGWRTYNNETYVQAKTKSEIENQLRNNVYRIW